MDSANRLNITLRSQETSLVGNQHINRQTDGSPVTCLSREVEFIYPSLHSVGQQAGPDDALPNEQDVTQRIVSPSHATSHDCSTSSAENEKMSETGMIEVAERVFQEMETPLEEQPPHCQQPDTTSDYEIAMALQEMLPSSEEAISTHSPSEPPLESRRSNQPPLNWLCDCSGSIRATINGVYYSGCYHNGTWVPDPTEHDDPLRNLENLCLLPSGLSAIFTQGNGGGQVSAEELVQFIEILSQIPVNYKAIIIKNYLDQLSFTISLRQIPSFIEGVNGNDVAKILQILKPHLEPEPSRDSLIDDLMLIIMDVVSDSDKVTVIESFLASDTDVLAAATIANIVLNVSDCYKAGVICALKPHLTTVPSHQLVVQVVNSCNDSYKVGVIKSLLENSKLNVTSDDLFDIVNGARDSYKKAIICALKPHLTTVPSHQLVVQVVNSCFDSYKVGVIKSLLENSKQNVTPGDLFDIVNGVSDSYKEKIIRALCPYLSSCPSHRLVNDIVDQCSRSYQRRVRDSLPQMPEYPGSGAGFQAASMGAPASYEEAVSGSSTHYTASNSSAAYLDNSFARHQFDDDWVLLE